MKKIKLDKKEKIYVVIIALLLALTVGLSALIFNADQIKASLYAKEYYENKVKTFKIENESCKKGQIVFIGDSITDLYPLDGLECFYPAFTPKQTEEITALCKKKHLLMSGGSDFHGAIRPKIALGVGAGELNVSKENIPWIQNTF